MTLVFEVFEMAERSDGCSGETFLAPCARRERMQRKMTIDFYWIGAQENNTLSIQEVMK